MGSNPALGAVAAGSAVTADAGVALLRAGGNAVDAAVAACFATAAGEPVLTSLAGGGVLLHRDGASGEVCVCDFFANAPGLDGAAASPLDFHRSELDFGASTQGFHVGIGSAAVPGVIPGLCGALERWGRLPLAAVVRPACRALRDGVVLDEFQARTFRVLEPILTLTAAGRQQFTAAGRVLEVGDRYRAPQLATLLEALAGGEWSERYRERVLEPLLGGFGPGSGGQLGSRDVEAYRVEFREPLESEYRGVRVHTNPPPAAGGAMLALLLGLLEGEAAAGWDEAGHAPLHALCRALAVADAARRELSLDRFRNEMPALRTRFSEGRGRPLGDGVPTRPVPGNTTHISVVDRDGNAAAVTFSHGEGCGHLIGDTGIQMNNLMGEEDLFPEGFHRWPPGERLSTMMAPTLLESAEGTLTVLGSGGANRIRSALAQVTRALVDGGLSPERAVAAPRLHFEGGVLHAETFGPPGRERHLRGLGARGFEPCPEPNLFFGGAHVVQRLPDGGFRGAGDPRRGGVFRIA